MNASKQKGTTWETAIVNYLQTWWPHVERRAPAGTRDRGDIAGIPGWIVEAKSVRDWQHRLSTWWKEASTEAENAHVAYPVLWIKRHGKTSAADGWVVMDGETYVRLLKDAGW